MAEIIKIEDNTVDNGSNSSVKNLQTNFDRLNTDLANRKVTQDIKDSDGNITVTVINDNNITPNKFANNSISSEKIDKTKEVITTNKFRNQGITSEDIADNIIDSLDKLRTLCDEDTYRKFLTQRGYIVVKNNLENSYMPGTVILYTRENAALNVNETDDVFKGVWE